MLLTYFDHNISFVLSLTPSPVLHVFITLQVPSRSYLVSCCITLASTTNRKFWRAFIYLSTMYFIRKCSNEPCRAKEPELFLEYEFIIKIRWISYKSDKCIYMYIYIYLYIYIYIYICVCVCVCVCTHAAIYLNLTQEVCTNTHLFKYLSPNVKPGISAGYCPVIPHLCLTLV